MHNHFGSWEGKREGVPRSNIPKALRLLVQVMPGVGKKDMKKYLKSIPLVLIFFFATVPVLTGCTRHKDRFWPDTQDGILQFTDPIVMSGDEERIISLKFIDSLGKTSAIRRLTHEFHIGDVVTVGVSVPVVGKYHEGGGWIFSGRKYYGKFGVTGDVTNVTSSNPEIVSGTVNQTGRLVLSALAPGTSKITVSTVISRRYADRHRDADKSVFKDTAVVNVIRQ